MREILGQQREKDIYDPERDGTIEHEGDLHVLKAVIEAAREADAAAREGREMKEGTPRVALFILPGVIRGAYGGGQVTALHEAGLRNGFSVIVGASTGAPIGAYLASGQPRMGTTIFSEECTTADFIRLKRLPDGHAEDAQFLADVFRGLTDKALDIEAIRKGRPDLIITATDQDTGETKLFDAKKEGRDIVELIRASITMPVLCREPVLIDGRLYVDGGIYGPMPIREIVEAYDPTHILVLANSPKKYEHSALFRHLKDAGSHFVSEGLGQAMRHMDGKFGEEFAELRALEIPSLIFWSDTAVRAFTKDPEIIQAGAERAEEDMKSMLENAQNLCA